MKRREAWYHIFRWKLILASWPFMLAQVKYVIFLHRLILHTAAAHAYVSRRP